MSPVIRPVLLILRTKRVVLENKRPDEGTVAACQGCLNGSDARALALIEVVNRDNDRRSVLSLADYRNGKNVSSSAMSSVVVCDANDCL